MASSCICFFVTTAKCQYYAGGKQDRLINVSTIRAVCIPIICTPVRRYDICPSRRFSRPASAQAASPLIGQKRGREKRSWGSKLIGRKWGEARIWLVRYGNGFHLIGLDFKEAGMKADYCTVTSVVHRMGLFIWPWLSKVGCGDSWRPSRGLQGVPSQIVSFNRSKCNV